MTKDAEHEAIIQKIHSYTNAAIETRESAIAVLISEGFLYPNGELTPTYGGKQSTKLAVDAR